VPFLAHATMEPQNCVAHVTADRAEIWAPTQDGETALAIAADAAGLPASKVVVNKMMLGCGFGRRGIFQDFVRQAVLIAKEVGQPVKLVWTREEDIRHDFYRPVAAARMTGGLDAGGTLIGWNIRTAGQSIIAAVSPRVMQFGVDRNFLQGLLEDMPYDVPNYRVDYAMRNTHVPVGPWRGVNTNQNAVYMECFIEEVARAANKDSLEFRRSLMGKYPKHLAVLNAAAEKAGYGNPLPPGVHRGIAQFMGYGSYSAAVAEVSVSPEGKLKVHRLVLALDSGHVVNPDQVNAQIEGSVAYGLTAALYGECPVKDGRMTDLNFDSYQIMRLAEMPRVETALVPSHDFWGGVGEPTICVVTPAVLNAIYAATGKPVRSLPLKNVKLV
jgi:isoquinoline 1-oxidoreductase subunit beta